MTTIENPTISRSTVLPKGTGKRMEWIDYAKGLAIILVVYRHSLVGLNRSGLNVPDFLYNIQEFALNFRMPVFFILSGIFLVRSLKKKTMSSLALQKTSTLLYPYLLWTVIFITIQIALSAYTNSDRTIRDYMYIITQPRNLDHMWYLLALFNTSILFIILSPWLLNRPLLHILFALGLHILAYIVREYSFFSDLFYHYIFLATGAILSDYLFNQTVDTNRRNLRALLLITPLFIIGQMAWLELRPGNGIMQLLFLVIIMIACYFFYLFCKTLYNAKVFPWLSFIGRHSIYIYILHLLIISSFRIILLHFLDLRNVYFIIFFSLLLGISIPILIYNIGKKWGINYLFSLEPVQKKTYG